jgi:hypothetical protein
MRYFFLTIFILSVNALSHATIFTVKQDGTGNFIKIQSAINIAYINDTVLVWPGTYYENLHIASKPITLASLYLTTGEKQYIYQTIIDGSTIQNSVIVADNFPSGSMGVICGFTVQHGDARFNEINYPLLYMGYGGGMFLYYADMKILGCLIQYNLAQVDGGGIKALHSSLYLSGTSIRHNMAFAKGGGLWYYGGAFLDLDTVNLNSIYFNHSIMGNDLLKHFSLPMSIFRVDTATTMNDRGYCIYNSNDYGSPIFDIQLVANHAMITQVNADLYVNPDGDNANSGLTPEEPLKNIWYAMTKINPDTNNRRTVHILPGTYSPSANGEIYPINGRSNSCLVGENMNTCILDAEQTWFHYSCHPYSYSLTLQNLQMINGNAVTSLETYFQPGSIDLHWAHYNISMENIIISGCSGLWASALLAGTMEYLYLNNIFVLNNYGGHALTADYDAVPFRNAIVARNISVIDNSYYSTGYGFNGGSFVISTSHNNYPLRATVAGAVICGNENYDSWGGSQHLECFLVNGRSNNITNVTIADNENKNHLPGAYATWEDMTSRVYNSVFYNNEHPSIILALDPSHYNPGELYLDYSLIEQGMDDIWNQQNFNILHYGVNNIEGNPLFVGTGEHPYELQAGSPCINTGTPIYEPGMEPPYIKQENGKYILYTDGNDTIHLPATDIAGNPRIAYGRIDMGAYEFKDTTVNIKPRPQFLASGIKASPNPFQQSTAIEFTLLKEGHYIVQIHDMQGRLLKTLLDTFTQPGNFHLRWHADDDNGNKLPSGNYIINLLFEGQNVGSLKVSKW